jgi:phage terminase large subunit
MSLLETVSQGHVLFEEGFSYIPSSKDVIKKIKTKLLPHQASFCDDTSHRKLALVCGFGAGKTYALVSKSIILACMNVGHISAIFEPTSPMLRDILMRTMNELLEEWEIPYTFRASPLPEYQLTFEEGTHTILLRTMLTYQRLRGQNLCAVGFDEADTIPKREAESAMNMALARLRSGNVQQFYATTTPEGHGWAFETFEKNKKSDTGLIQAKTKDNPYLPNNFIQSLEENYPPQLIKAYLLGQWVNLTSGQVYNRFSREHHVINKIPFDIKMETLLCGIDFNVMNCNCVIGVRDGDKLVIIDEISKQKDTDALAQELLRRYPSNRILVYPDASGSARSTINASKTDLAILQGYGFGSMALKSNPFIKDRVATVNALLQNGKGERRLAIHASCTRLIECLELQSYDEKTGDPDKQNGYDHMNDALGYLIYREFNLLYGRAGKRTGIRIY